MEFLVQTLVLVYLVVELVLLDRVVVLGHKVKVLVLMTY